MLTEPEILTDATELARQLRERRSEPVAYDVETSYDEESDLGIYRGDRCVCVSMYFRGRVYVMDPDTARPAVEALPHGPVLMHGGKFDREVAAMTWGVEIPDHRCIDTLTCEWLLRENGTWSKKLKDLATRYLGRYASEPDRKLKKLLGGTPLKELAPEFYRPGWVTWEEAQALARQDARAQRRTRESLTIAEWAEYAGADAEITMKVFEHQSAEMAGLSGHVGDVLPAGRRETLIDGFTLRLQRTGVRVDRDRVEAYLDDARARAEWLMAPFEDVNLDSPRQLANLLFGEWNLPPAKLTPGGIESDPGWEKYSTDRSVLERLSWDRRVARIMEYREQTKLASAFYAKLLDPGLDGRIHPEWRQRKVETGRYACASPNFQQIPRRRRSGRRCKAVFAPEPGMRLLEMDLDQAELRIGAAMANERKLLDIFRAGDVKVYQAVADEMGVPYDVAKAVTLSVQYGSGVDRLAITLAYGTGRQPDPVRAKEVKDTFWGTYRDLQRTFRHWSDHWERTGILPVGEAWPGRIRHLETIWTDPKGHRKIHGLPEKAYTAFNSRVQGGQAEYVKDVMLALEPALASIGRIVMMIHDSLVLEVEEGAEEKAAELVRTASADLNPWSDKVDLPWSLSLWEPAPCWRMPAQAPNWWCSLPWGHGGDCRYEPIEEDG